MSKPPRARYRTTNWRSFNAALALRGSLQVWFDPGMQWLSAPTGKHGRQPVFSDAAIQACQPRSGPLHLLIDSTGIKAVGDGEWCRRKHGPSKRRQWRKVHLGVDAGSLEIRAIEVTVSRVGDAPMLPERLEQIPPDQAIATVSADGAFDTRVCHEAIAARDACAIIPARSNAKAWPGSTPGVAVRN